MKKFRNLVVAFFIAFLSIITGVEAIEFSADMCTNYNNKMNQQAKIYIKGDNSKIQPQGMGQYFINKGDKTYIIMPNAGQYMVQDCTEESSPKLGYDYNSKSVNKKYLGTEFVNGVNAKKYEVTGDNGEKVHLWMLKDIIPVRVKPLGAPVVIDFKNIKFSVSNSEFNIPQGYKPMSIQNMMGNYPPQMSQQMQQQYVQYQQQPQQNIQQQYNSGLNKVDQSTNNVDKGVDRVNKVIDTTDRVKSLFGF